MGLAQVPTREKMVCIGLYRIIMLTLPDNWSKHVYSHVGLQSMVLSLCVGLCDVEHIDSIFVCGPDDFLGEFISK